jgi:hypothetical protein
MALPLRILRTLGLLAVLLAAAATVLWWGWGRAARERACAASCLSNLKQLRLAVLMYAYDYDKVLPPADNYFELAELVSPYTRNWSLSFCPIGSCDEPCMFCYGWNYRLAGKRIDSLGPLARQPMLFDRRPWHGGKRLAVPFEGEPFTTSAPVPMRRLSEQELRRHTYTSHRLNRKLRRAWQHSHWRTAERLYAEALGEAGDNPHVGPELYEELIAVQCKLGRLSVAEATFRDMRRKYPDAYLTPEAKELIGNAKRGVPPDMGAYLEERFWAMWRY